MLNIEIYRRNQCILSSLYLYFCPHFYFSQERHSRCERNAYFVIIRVILILIYNIDIDIIWYPCIRRGQRQGQHNFEVPPWTMDGAWWWWWGGGGWNLIA